MALRLKIVSEHRRALGQRSSIVFGVGGGSIGRSADNDWVLPDPQRFLSGHHARIHFRHGLFMLEDTSTNGTYLNDAAEPIPKRTPCELHNGDMLRLGEYEVVVAIDGAADQTAERTADIRVEAAMVEQSHDQTAPRVEDNLEISLSPSALFSVEAAAPAALQVGNAYGQAVVLPFSSPATVARAPDPAENSDIIAARRLERLKRAAAARDTTDPATRAAFEAFCRGAGVDAADLPTESAVAMLQLAGRLLREALVGLKDLEVKRAELRRELGLPAPAAAEQSTPFSVTAPADDLIAQLLRSHDSRRLDPAQWLRQAFELAKRHDASLAGALPAALRELMHELQPDVLEERFARSGSRAAGGGRPPNWELYAEFVRTLGAQADSGMPHLFVERLRAAYAGDVAQQP
jgi:type VI secretion system protein